MTDSAPGKMVVVVLSWLRAVEAGIAGDRASPTRLVDIDARTAIQISRYLVASDLAFFLSKQDLADRLSCAKSTAEASLGRLERAGLLQAIAPPDRLRRSRRSPGRMAKCFRIAGFRRPEPAVSPGQSGETKPPKSPGQSGEISPISPGSPGEINLAISPDQSGRVSPDQSGPNRTDRKEGPRHGRSLVPASDFGPEFDEVWDGALIDDYDLDIGEGRAGARSALPRGQGGRQ